MKKLGNKIAFGLAALLSSGGVHAGGKTSDVLEHMTVGIWAESPLGTSARLGLAVPTGANEAITIGHEFGLYGSKDFVGYRAAATGHGVFFGAIDLARWKTRSHPWLAEEGTVYYGVEAQLLILRAGLMFPKGSDHHPTVTFGLGFGF
ncbi:hypothetical protein [Pseudoduganella violaceinigra]|uniref:hypothetical protein n=1 Tax=Pseudoduganella violaceinigra TaxID=246602 RepID=UPI00047FB397|nr:hypothetical protein [Pseudoduganella violaceinigra]